MQGVQNHIREWATAVLAVGAVLLTAVYAVTKESRAADGIRDARQLAATLTEAATSVSRTTLTPEQIEELKRRQTDLATRAADTKKPGCVAAELTETARKTGLVVGGIQPIEDAPQAGARSEKSLNLGYRILVEGTYSQIGEYMDACGRQRLPAHTRQFRITRVNNELTDGEVILKAEIVVEPFCPTDEMRESGSK
jgi:hypothetical protein